MHNNELPQFAIDGALRRRGRYHLFEDIEPKKTALVVIDMQNAFMQEGAPAEVPIAREIVPNINRLVTATRAAGGTVVWVQMTQTSENIDDWSVYYGGVNKPERAETVLKWLTEGSEGHQIWPDLQVNDNDMFILKDRYSAFLPASSDIEERLRAEGIDTVLITGTLTNVCCESSARDAMMRNFKVIMAADANATLTDEEHTASLASIFQVFGDVMSTDEVVELLNKGSNIQYQSQAAE